MKNYFLILLSVFGIGFLIDGASNASSVPDTAISSEIIQMETIPTLSKIENLTLQSVTDITTTAKITTTSTTKSSSRTSIPNYTITDHPATVKSRDLSYHDIYRTKNLVYGHNSANLLGSIKNLGVGSTFTITENGITNTYQVQDVRIFAKTSNTTLELCNSGYNDCTGGTYYINTLQNATFRGANYSIALFTCDGTSLGGGDATHRRVVFAYKV